MIKFIVVTRIIGIDIEDEDQDKCGDCNQKKMSQENAYESPKYHCSLFNRKLSSDQYLDNITFRCDECHKANEVVTG